MLRISRDQKRTFDDAALDDYVARTAARIGREFATDAALMGGAGVISLIELGMERARRRGIESEQGVDVYLNLMLQLGAEFDVDPQLPWLAPILAESGAHRAPLADRLDRAARCHLVAVAGRDFEHQQAALERLARLSFAELPREEAGIAGWLSLLHPHKLSSLEPHHAVELVQRARVSAQAHGLDESTGHALYAALMLLFGSGFERDPALPWALRALQGARRAPHATRSSELHERLRTELHRYVE